MRSLGDKSFLNWPSRTRSGKDYSRTLQLSGDAKENVEDKDGADLLPQYSIFTDDSVVYKHEGQTHAEALEGETQVLGDFNDGFSSELYDGFCDTQVFEYSEDTCQAQRGSLESKRHVSNVENDNNDTGLDDMEAGDTQILDDPEDMSQSQLPNFVARSEKNEYCKENLSKLIFNGRCEQLQLGTQGLFTTSDERNTVSNAGTRNCSSRDMDIFYSLSDCVTDGTVDHTAGMSVSRTANNNDDTPGCVPPRFTEISGAADQSRLEKKNSELDCSTSTNTNRCPQKQDEKDTKTSGCVPLRFTEIRVEAWRAYGLEVKKKALNAKAVGDICSIGTSSLKQKHADKENDNSVKGSQSNVEGTDDEDFTGFNEPNNGNFLNGKKVKSSVIRKLFAEDAPQTEACGIILTGDDEPELPAGEGDTVAAELSYIESQEPNDLAHTKALDFVEKFLVDSLADIDTNDHGGPRVKNKNYVPHSNSEKSLLKKSILRSTVGLSKAYDWDDNNEDEGGGAFFCKLKEKTSKKECDFVKCALPIQKFYPANSELLDNVSEQSIAKAKKRKLTNSDKGIVPQNLKKTAKNVEGNAKEHVINARNRDCTGNNALYHNTPDMLTEVKHVSAGTSAVKESHTGHDTCQSTIREKGPSEGFSMGRTRKGSYIKVNNMKKKAFRNCEMTSGESEEHVNGTTKDLKINGLLRRSKHDDKDSYRKIKNQSKNSVIMTCTRQTRSASLQNRLNTAETETVHDDFVKPIEQHAELSRVERSRTTSPIGHEAVEVNSKDASIKVINDQIYQVHLVEHQMQLKPTSRDKIVGDLMNISRNQQRIPLRRSHRLNRSLTLEDLSAQNVNKPLLQKRRVFITPNTKPGKEVIACLVKAFGGQVIGRITWSALRDKHICDSLLILTCEEDLAVCEPLMEKGAKVYSSELILNGIVTQRLDFERYRLFDDCRKRTTRRNGGRKTGR